VTSLLQNGVLNMTAEMQQTGGPNPRENKGFKGSCCPDAGAAGTVICLSSAKGI
jgi:hypothetical protein